MSDAVLAERTVYAPHVDYLSIPGENRFLAKIHLNEEVKSAGGIVIPELAQDYPTTGQVLKLSEEFDSRKYPTISEGRCVKVTMNGWNRFKLDGVWYAVGHAGNVLATYDPSDVGL